MRDGVGLDELSDRLHEVVWITSKAIRSLVIVRSVIPDRAIST